MNPTFGALGRVSTINLLQSRWSLPQLGYLKASSIMHHLYLYLFFTIAICVAVNRYTENFNMPELDEAAAILVVMRISFEILILKSFKEQ